ncbi:MAG: dienelactone hydrolase family protein [Fimbriimonas sp.]
MTPACVRLGEKLVEAGFHVWMPLLFGKPNTIKFAGTFTSRCIYREIHLFRTNSSHPLTQWLRELTNQLNAQQGGNGVGVIGMCLTGNFAITLIAEKTVHAAVTCQPSIPAFSACALSMTSDELVAAKESLKPLVGLRFDTDRLCPKARFDRLEDAFGANFLRHDLPGNGHGVLTGDFVDREGHPTRKSLDFVIDYLHQRLEGYPAPK